MRYQVEFRRQVTVTETVMLTVEAETAKQAIDAGNRLGEAMPTGHEPGGVKRASCVPDRWYAHAAAPEGERVAERKKLKTLRDGGRWGRSGEYEFHVEPALIEDIVSFVTDERWRELNINRHGITCAAVRRWPRDRRELWISDGSSDDANPEFVRVY